MSSSFEKSVKGGTKIKLAAPKSKYVEHILIATHAGEAGVAEIFRALQTRLRDSTWTIVFKSLIIIHLMVREGEPDMTLRYLAANPRKLAVGNFSDGGYRAQLLGKFQVQGQNIRNYSQYLLDRAQGFKETKIDYVRDGEGRFKKLTVEKGLLRETETVQHSIDALLKCDLLTVEQENEITICAFRLLVTDLLVLFHVMNEGVINILEHFFEMSKYDADRALGIYKKFAKQTNQVVEFLGVARHYEDSTRLEVPKIKHAPTSLTASLEDYLNDRDFEINRRQYIAQQDVKKGRGTSNGAATKPFSSESAKPSIPSRNANAPDFSAPKPVAQQPQAAAKGPAPDLIDLFESIEQNQQPMAHALPQQQTAQVPQFQQAPPTQQFQQMGFGHQPNAYPQQQQQQPPPGFVGGYGQVQPQPQLPQRQMQPTFTGFPPPQQPSFTPIQSSLASIPQNGVAEFETQKYLQSPQQQTSPTGGPPQTTNPFRQSLMPNSTGSTVVSTFSSVPSTGSTPAPQVRQQGTNPFAKSPQLPSSFPDPQKTQQQQPSPFTSQLPPVQPPSQVPSIQPPFQSALPPQQQQQQQQQPLTQSPFRAQQSGTNPFTRTTATAPSISPSMPAPLQQPQQQTGAAGTNPFRQSAMPVQQQQQTGWQPGQPTLGGLEQLPTVNVFPRAGGGAGQGSGGGRGW